MKLKNFLIKLSRVIFWLIPVEFKKNKLQDEVESQLKKKIINNLAEETFNNFKDDFKKSVLLYNYKETREYAVKTSLLNDINKNYYYLEFGVWKGESANLFSKYVKKLHAFDGFEGLKEDWSGTSFGKGSLNLNKQIPKLNSNVEPIVGWVQDTLDDFLKKHNPKVNFVHLDMDTYGSTKFTLERLKPYLVKDAIIIFDELYNFIGWENGEYKALNEVFEKKEYEYKAFNVNGCNSVIQIK
tara:strand:+ start:4639 stop:5361 length:723 start_codon:yes stop_codon:yes gene_type:complete